MWFKRSGGEHKCIPGLVGEQSPQRLCEGNGPICKEQQMERGTGSSLVEGGFRGNRKYC